MRRRDCFGNSMLGLKPGRAFRWELARSCALYSKLYGAKHTRDLSQAQGLESGPPLGQGASAVALPHALPHAVSQRIPWLNAQESHQIRLPDFAKRARWLCAQRVTQEAPRGPSAASLALDLNPEQQRAVETGERTVRVKVRPWLARSPRGTYACATSRHPVPPPIHAGRVLPCG